MWQQHRYRPTGSVRHIFFCSVHVLETSGSDPEPGAEELRCDRVEKLTGKMKTGLALWHTKVVLRQSSFGGGGTVHGWGGGVQW